MTTVRIIGICFVCTLLAGGVASSALAAGGVGTLSQHPGAEGCVTQDGTDGASGICRVGRGFDEISMTVISPDGRFLYASSIDPANAILVFAIDQVNGALTQLAGTNGCVSDGGTDGAVGFCVDGRALGEVKHLAISPGGEHLYAAAAGSDASNAGTVAVFARDAATGVLTQLAGTDGCIRQGAAGPDGCAVGRGMGEPTSVTVSPDGQNVYVTGSAGGTPEGVAVFTRAGTGALTQLAGPAGCITHDGADGMAGACADGRALFEPTSLVVSRDLKNVYVAVSEGIPGPPHGPGAIASFSRASTGALTQLATTAGCNSAAAGEGCASAKGLMDAITIAITPDDKHVYVAAQGETTSATGVGALSAFSRDPGTGALTQLPGTAGCISANGGEGSDAGVPGQCATARAFTEPNGIAFGPGAEQVYVGAGDDKAVGVFRRNPVSGELTQLEGEDGCIRTFGGAGCESGRALGAGTQHGPRDLAMGPNCNFLYVAATDTPGIAVLRRGCTPPTSAVTVAPCSTSGNVPVTVTDAAGAVLPKRMHFRINGGPEQMLLTSVGAAGTTVLDVPEGRHSVEYWGEDETGVLESLHQSVSVVVDRTAPAVAITGPVALTVGQPGVATVIATDATSGLAVDPSAAAVRLDTASPGPKSLTRAAVDRCGNASTTTLAYTVAEPLALRCTRSTVALIDVVRAGRRVRITGQAPPADAGKSVKLFLADKRRKTAKPALVGSAKVGPTGTFAATLRGPSGKTQIPQYIAQGVDGKRSKPLELDRRMLVDALTAARGAITVRGHVTKPLPKKAGQVVTITVQKDCARATVVGTAKLDKRGRFSLSFAAPAGVPEVLVRAGTKVPTRAGGPSRFRTFSLPRPVVLG